MRQSAFVITSLLAAQFAYAQYKCVENGKTLITDRPCASLTAQPESRSSSNVIGDAQNSDYSTTNGAWRGQVQFMAKSGTNVISEAHSVASIVIEIDPKGKVTGSSTETGCTLKGIAMPGLAASITNLDVTLSNCRYSGYNRQMSGRIALYQAQGYTDFSIVAYDMGKRPPFTYEIKGNLRR